MKRAKPLTIGDIKKDIREYVERNEGKTWKWFLFLVIMLTILWSLGNG